MRKGNFSKIFCVLFYIFVFLFLLKNSYNYLDPDLGWHLKVGERIMTEKQVPSINYYNYTLNNKKWVDHEWLSNAGMYLLYKNFGYASLNFLFALVLLTALIILNVFTKKLLPRERGTPFFIFLLQFLGLMAMLPHIGVRIQEITILNLLLLIILIHRYEKTKNLKILFVLPCFFYFWACLHAGFLIGLFILVLWMAVRLAELFIKKYWNPSFLDFNHDLKIRHIKNVFLFSVLSALATLITPYGLELYSFLSGYKDTYYLKHIQEWLPIYYTPIMLWQLLYESIAAVAIILVALFSIKTKGREYKINLWQMAVSALFLILAMKSKRHFPLFFIASFSMMTGFFSSYLKIPREIMPREKSKPMLFVKIYVIAGLFLVSFLLLARMNFTRDPFASFCGSYPCEAVEFLKSNPRYHDLNIFNTYGWGGYLIWVWPEKQLFIDGRLPQYEFAGHTMMEEYHEFFNEDENEINNKLKQYDIKLVLLKKDRPRKLNWFEEYILQMNQEKINKKENELENFLDNSNSWRKIYSDNTSYIYVSLK
ncbi:MAG: hypothetical protein V1825_00975 [Candidatus Falkowbacteria bacterium]